MRALRKLNFKVCSYWDNVSLVQSGRYTPSNNVQYVRDFVSRYACFFNQASCVLVERQMRCNMRIVEAVIQTLYYDVCTIINARSVKAHYDLGTKNYKLNKQRAIEWADAFVSNNPNAFFGDVAEKFKGVKKRDDLADSLLLITYYLDTYSNQLSSVDALFAFVDGQ